MSNLVTSVVKKCKKEDIKNGRKWCIYKPEKEGSSKIKKPQPKYWPKTYETKKDAEYGLKMMKTFGSVDLVNSWYVNVLISKAITLSSSNLCKNKDVKIFLKHFKNILKNEINTLNFW